MVFYWYPIPQIIFGEGAVNEVGDQAELLGIKKACLISDQGIRSLGLVDKVEALIKKAGVEVVTWDKVLPNPEDVQIDAAADFARKAGCDGTIGLGGGSVLDTAKTVNILLNHPGETRDYLFGGQYDVDMSILRPLIQIPTTSGTGAEVSIGAVVTNTELHMKLGSGGFFNFPKVAIVDPALTVGMPAKMTAQTAFDAYAHHMEAYVSVTCNPFSDVLAVAGMETVVKYLPIAVKDTKNVEARAKLAFASLTAAMAFNNSMVNIGHTFAHTIGAVTHLTHGDCLSIGQSFIPALLAPAVPERIRKIGEILGLQLAPNLSSEELGKQVGAGLKAFIKSVGLPTSMTEAGAKNPNIKAIADLIKMDATLKYAPVGLEYDRSIELLNSMV